MNPVLTAREMSLADRAAIEELRTGETRLMELAGRETARMIAGRFEHSKSLDGVSALVVCGKGNNGGDGFVVARHLLNRGARVDVLLVWPEDDLAGVNLEGLHILKAYRRYNEGLRIFAGIYEARTTVGATEYQVVVDAIFGTGLRIDTEDPELREPARSAVELINFVNAHSEAVTVAIDLPSGLDATSGRSSEPCVNADMTVTMAFLKTGFFQNSGPSLCGEIQTAEISIPEFLVEPTSCLLVDEAFAAESYLLRDPSSAKHLNGKVLLVTGSADGGGSMLGAALLAARAAVKTGAGYVCASLPDGQAAVMHSFAPEVVVIGRDMISIIEKAKWADAIVIGCGIGRSDEAQELVETLLCTPEIAGKKLVLDADALYAIAERDLFDRVSSLEDAVLTPHAGECSRLSGLSVEDIMLSPIDTARMLAEEWNVNLLLKGMPTFIASPSGMVLISNSGTEALASAGTGDVLSGMIGALAAKGLDSHEAAAAAAWLHGRAGDLASNVSSLVSSVDVLQAIPQAVLELFESEE
ncbi:bifunctional ADP-dependent (S)-NAD(P)H-hydrate dehydratase/NAD(P)H-hydrate epimerase [Chlorobaculum limnaeum]|uniref:Bifunctional NAD(P)H-hydrate repair enzyme n=1 Tax=Chlorobaculum limnaeum TaxID=274537 RepID=A0A1D8CX70_CHLLM|nr:bifunctional ADP-dependent NAD(P)H-hydrate dehydratase/NAD(P)H-hydrate epimerase [Chlorobaculum limnaeum]AOS83520.1 bifunctional ADP-dependent (S)-NAD(P)H-hydrate dehydratase/NAD(P)H-hydrate epimerase [Chlorobaculum limnaeum]